MKEDNRQTRRPVLRYRWKPFELLGKAEKRRVEIPIPGYIHEEPRLVFERNGTDFTPVKAFLGTFYFLHTDLLNLNPFNVM